MKNTVKSRTPFPEFQTGQVWEMPESRLQISQVGKTLVHYKHYRGKTLRAPVSLANKAALEKYLVEQKAVLI